jgi:hypothetical protein
MNVPVRPPDFDDERTLLSARRVVPLAKVRRRRHWALGGAFAVAMMLGAASALVVSYLKLRNVPPATATATAGEVLEPEDGPAPVAVVANTPDAIPTESPAEETPKKESILKRRIGVKHTPEPMETHDNPQVTEDERLQQIRDAVLYDQWQERRARRVFRRQRRLDRYNHRRDLSNLDEIFEGRRP